MSDNTDSEVTDKDPTGRVGGIDVQRTSRRYLLGLRGERYGIWDKSDPEPIEAFPGTDEGLALAESRFSELAAAERVHRDTATLVLGILISVGLVVWLVAGIVEAIIFRLTNQYTSNRFVGVLQLAQAIDGVAFRIWVSAGVLLLLLRLYRSKAPNPLV